MPLAENIDRSSFVNLVVYSGLLVTASCLPAGVAGAAVSGVAGSLVASNWEHVWSDISERLSRHDALETNALIKCIGKALAATLTSISKQREFSPIKAKLVAMSKIASHQWLEVLAPQNCIVAGRNKVIRLNADNEIFLSQSEWCLILKGLEGRTSPTEGMGLFSRQLYHLTQNDMQSLADEVQQFFPLAFRTVLAEDFTKDGKAFASFILASISNFQIEMQQYGQSMEDIKKLIQKFSAGDERTREALQAIGEAIDTGVSSEISADQYGQIKQNLLLASKGLLSVRQTLNNQRHISRPELVNLLGRIKSSTTSTTIVLGAPGVGKSALMATFGKELCAQGYVVLAIKADELNGAIQTIEDLQLDLHLDLHPIDAMLAISGKEPVVLLVDQLDAISELLDLKSQRLNLLLSLIQRLSGSENVHIVATCREFEFSYSSQLHRLSYIDQLFLNLPAWDDVAAILKEGGHLPDNMGEPLREVLQNPLHLNIFLEVAQPGDVFSSSQKLLDHLWAKRVTNQTEAEQCVTFLEKLAERMTEEEVLWVPSAISDTSPKIRQTLEQAGVLTTNSENGNIGFRHQTYYDHALARSFARGTKSLIDIVLERQSGLFVRPILLRGLSYLRGTDSLQYKKQLTSLMQAEQYRIRTHIRSLLLEFMGAQTNPDSVEARLLIPLLNSEAEGIKVLKVTVGSQGWFNHLRSSPEFTQWLAKTAEQAVYCRPLLYVAASFAPEEVWQLLESYWLHNQTYDFLSIRVLWNIDHWTPQRVRFAEQIIRRSKIEWHEVSGIAEKIDEALPHDAPRVILAHLDFLLAKAIETSQIQVPEPPFETSEVEEYNYSFVENVRRLLESKGDLYEIEKFAQVNSEAFLYTIWPWVIDVIEKISIENSGSDTSYRNDHSMGLDHYHGEVVEAILVAITDLAVNNREQFFKFLEDNQESDLLLVHRLFARGLEKIAEQVPQTILAYLLGDKRRLCLGDGIEGCHFETKRLISSVCPHLDPEDREKIENAIRKFNYCSPIDTFSAGKRLGFLKYNRQHRLQLLLAFPDDCLSLTGKRLIDEEIRAFPWVIEEDRTPFMCEDPLIGPRVTSEEMKHASDQHLLRLFDELHDGTRGERSMRNRHLSNSRSGGANQQSQAFGNLIKNDPERFLRLLPQLHPQRHESYVAASLISLSEIDYPAEQLVQIVEAISIRGFRSESLCENAARALSNIAGRNKGLPDSIQALLLDWLPKQTRPELGHHRSKAESYSNRKTPILFGFGGHDALSGGRCIIVRAIAQGFIKQDPPNLLCWAKFIRSQVGVEHHPAIWVEVLRHMPILLNEDRSEATELFDLVIRNCPETLNFFSALFPISRTIGLFEPKETVHGWLEMLQTNSSEFSHQAYGELLVLQYFQYQDEWSLGRIRNHLRSLGDEAVLCGLAHAASHLWGQPRCRAMAAEILTNLASSANSSVQNAIASVFHLSRDIFQLCDGMLQILEAVCKNQSILIEAANVLVEIIEEEDLVNSHPEIVVEVCQSLLGIGEELTNPTRPSILVAESLTTIVIQLHRQPQYREIGLQLFEHLLELNLRETQAALETLDRKPNRSSSYSAPRRRLRSRSKKVV
ncbi:hypothetical protein C1752_08436 [Acaryochloris thomasi RCC1774]|uniref:ATPase AAA-type core domain-containing protein n=1 Tax=Acaryochloris thomasi RCC1774 TaxID=1764569 RepID=A0A2W1JLC2_9CYAN|nr:ATP-binding protein [Acaryochloris thomasi]PZD70994.1 hypothetical protein C1752_08436 [Acaryochloris thomasi RCC1774]